MSLCWPPGHVDTVMKGKTTSMATIVKQWNGLPGRAGESLFVCYSWTELLLGLTPPRFCGGTHQRISFFSDHGALPIWHTEFLFAAVLLQKSRLIPVR